MFSCEFYEIFKNIIFIEHIWLAASVKTWITQSVKCKTYMLAHNKQAGSSETAYLIKSFQPLHQQEEPVGAIYLRSEQTDLLKYFSKDWTQYWSL